MGDVDQAQIFYLLLSLKKAVGDVGYLYIIAILMALGHWRYQKRSRCYWARRFLSQADGRTARSSLEQRYLMNFLVYFTDSADINKTLARHAKELLKTSDKRAGKFRMNLASINQCPEKWKLWCDMFTEQSNDHKEDEFLTTFLNSGASRSTLISVRLPC